MKKVTWIAALLVVVMVFSAGCSLIQVNPDRDAKRPVAKVNGTELLKEQFLALYTSNKSAFGITDAMEKDSQYADTIKNVKDYVIDYMVETELTKQYAANNGIALTDEDIEKVTKEVDEQLDSYRETYRSSQKAQGKDDSDEAVNKLLEEYLKKAYLSRDIMIDMSLSNEIVEKVREEVTKDVEVTEDEVRESFDSKVESDKNTYGSNPSAFENALLNGTKVYYTPAGYRYIKQILISFDQAVMSDISEKRTNGDTEGADALRDEQAKLLEERAQKALDALDVGTSFTLVQRQYSDDKAYDQYPEGYPVSADSASYVTEFKDGAMALKSIGEYSGMIVSDYGIHILYYASDIPEGEASYEASAPELRESLLETAKTNAYEAKVDEWAKDADIKKYNKVVY